MLPHQRPGDIPLGDRQEIVDLTLRVRKLPPRGA